MQPLGCRCAPCSIPFLPWRRQEPSPHFSGSRDWVCTCMAEDAVSYPWDCSVRGREALITHGEEDVSLLYWALLSNFSTG